MTLVLVCVGQAPDDLTLGALQALRDPARPRLARTGRHPAIDWLQSPDGGVRFDTVFDEADDPRALAARVVALAEMGDVLYAVPGTGPADDPSALDLLARVQAGSFPVALFPAAPVRRDAWADLDALAAVMARLRDPQDGCPWDREQTPETLRRYVIEEAYEVVEAVEGGDSGKLCEELGDLLLQVVFHAQLAREEGRFDLEDVTRGIIRKLVRRHPHVFGDLVLSSSDQVLTRWEQIKRAEPGYEERRSLLDGIPKGLPALMRALEVSRRVVKVGFEWPSVLEILDKVEEEIGELRAELKAGNGTRSAEELGDLLFTLVNVARQMQVDPEETLRRMTERFAARFRHIEDYAAGAGRLVSDLSLHEMESVWQAAKRER